MKKVLMLASVASMISQFNMSNILILKELGYEVDVACNFLKGNTCNQKEIDKLKEKLKALNISCFQIDFSRRLSALSKNFKSYCQVKKLLKKQNYSFIHCHSPIGGVIGRLAGWWTGTKVIYTAHGFHFYKGAPIKNWLLFYPVEWACSWMTDIIIAINQEDYRRAEKKFHAKRVVYIPGIGIEVKKTTDCRYSREEKRKNIGLQPDNKMLLSVGELSERKNHEIVINAIGMMKTPHVKYYICGQGEKREHYEKIIKKNNLESQVFLLGYRNDIFELCQAADLFIFPSLQEGLPVALMEAMASGVPVICSKIRGNTDLIEREEFLFNPYKVESLLCLLNKIMKQNDIDKTELKSFATYNYNKVQLFSKNVIEEKMLKLYKEMVNIKTIL